MSLESKQYLMRITDRPDLVMVRGAGSYLWDTNGRRYLDFVQGWAVNALGHSAREVATALAEQAATLCTASPALHNSWELALAARLTELSGMAQAHFCSSGAEANEAALKLVRKWGERERGGAYEVVTTHDSFHGRTLAMMSASGKPGWDRMFLPQLAGFVKVPYGDPDAVRAAIGPRTVAVMVEPIQGEGGVVMPPPGYLRALRALCDCHRVLFVLDEVQTGIGRTGTLFAWQAEGVVPDVMTLGKGLGSGVPIAALLAARRACCFEPGDQGGTYNGNALVTAVALAVLEVVTAPGFLGHVGAIGQYLGRQLASLGIRHGGRVRGRGLLWAMLLSRPSAEEVARRCLEQGLILNVPRPHILRFMPSLRVTAEEIDEMLTVLSDALVRAAA
jgi:acetylornithine/N-succinyldiaminopimelate aminotransferase